ncbi:helix-turn-helix domain-containing protein [Fulvivirga sedimenti]|uniref:LuxR C-terminal-related transcriptional regulator n=1 Tax=Fulvivirga sedimenti TaxID=2879465 RepID=A0A9X1HNZ1_9BACT|nr:helix-turn-helix transcriptional regulator [Fulvivirga sedimenti]MCA6075628.1 LuxR C-terminal-related transcriptional regulator [Fulvivirga sedimenti]
MKIEESIGFFNLERDHKIDEFQSALESLNNIPNSFFAINWYSSSDYLWISKTVEKVSGYDIRNFQKMGIMFILSITPKELIDPISAQLTREIADLEKDLRLLTKPVIMDVDGGITRPDGELVRLKCLTAILDQVSGPKRTYFVLSTYISMNHDKAQLEVATNEAKSLLKKIHSLYIEMKPKRFKSIEAICSLTSREREVADLIRNGENSKEIAGHLNIATNTVISHRKNLLKKLDVRNTAEMVHLINSIL